MDDKPIEEMMAETVAAAEPEMRFSRPDVFSHLIEGENDLIGIVAYSIYKQEKRDWLMRWEASHGEPPSVSEVEAFVLANLTEGQKERYRIAAQSVLDGYEGQFSARPVDEPMVKPPASPIEAGLARRIETAADRVEHAAVKVRRAGWFGAQVVAGAIGAIAVALIVGGVWYGLEAAGVDILAGVPFAQP
ncbi:MAG: hypothetical protein IT535_04305 [Bauldia sp.]|nr:hypothetical protein [Bauldia sp.]